MCTLILSWGCALTYFHMFAKTLNNVVYYIYYIIYQFFTYFHACARARERMAVCAKNGAFGAK